ncbi:MAG: hypothetical protein ABIR54_12440 [Burkholderiaceae bacterium]
MQPRLARGLVLIAAIALARPALCADAPAEGQIAKPASNVDALTPVDGLVMLDYQSIPIRGYPSIDLLGAHVLTQVSDGLYLGVGAHAPLVKGNYGGFMAFDVTLHAQHDVVGRLYADAGVSVGGGAGGGSAQQAKIIAGSGGFIKGYAGLGYRFDDFSAGVNLSRARFTQSVISGTQLDFFVQLPFTYTIGAYASAGRHYPLDLAAAPAVPDANVMTFGLDNFFQIKPTGSFKGTVSLADVQFDHFLTSDVYLLVEGSVGVRGLPIYNQILGGAGYRHAVDPRLKLSAQVAVGSGGYAPDRIDTGPGLLVYPKLSAEYRLTDSLGLSLTGGYLFAPRGTSRNLTLGAALDYHLSPDRWHLLDGGSRDTVHQGYRYSVFQQSELKPRIGDRTQGTIKLLTSQIDNILDDNVYLPMQASIAYSRFLGYPGYGEVLAGLGAQTKYASEQPLQAYAQLLAGINVHGVIAKPAVGLNVGLSDHLALFAQVGKTLSVNVARLYPERYRFNTTNVGVGLTYRFSLAM